MTDTSYLEVLCRFSRHIRIVGMVSVLCIVLLLASLYFGDLDRGTYIITVVQLVTFLILGVGAFGVLVVCARHSPE